MLSARYRVAPGTAFRARAFVFKELKRRKAVFVYALGLDATRRRFDPRAGVEDQPATTGCQNEAKPEFRQKSGQAAQGPGLQFAKAVPAGTGIASVYVYAGDLIQDVWRRRECEDNCGAIVRLQIAARKAASSNTLLK